MTWQVLAQAIKSCLSDPVMQENAAKLGETLRNENGSVQAAKEVELFWTEFVQTGEFSRRFPGEKVQSNHPRKLWVVGAAVVAAVAIYWGRRRR